MPFLTNEDIEQRKAEGKALNKLDCGWNLTAEQTARIVTFINGFEPQNDFEIRDKRILEYAFINDMNASQIARQNDPLLVGMENRNHGRPLSASWIWSTCIKYFPELNRHGGTSKPKRKKRNDLLKQQISGEIGKPKICGCCGSRKTLELHHIIPIAAGGTNDYYNMIYLCHDCHMKLHHKIYDWLNIPK